MYLTFIPRTCVGYELLDSGRGNTESAIISSYTTSVSGMIVLLNTKKLDKNISNFIEVITELSIQPALKFRGQFPYLGKAQDIRFIP